VRQDIDASISIYLLHERRIAVPAFIAQNTSLATPSLTVGFLKLSGIIHTFRVMKEEDLTNTLALGRRGEELAAEYLEAVGYRLVAANFTLPIGRNLRGTIVNAEIDMVGYDGAVLCFIEVKTRASNWFAPPEANVDLRKQRQVTRAARAYRRLFGLVGAPYRFDVISVTLSPVATPAATVNAPSPSTSPRIELHKNFWSPDKFRKHKWSDTHFDY